MRIKFSQHALDQLRLRKRISRAMVIETITAPDRVLESYRGRKQFQKHYAGEILEVVTVKEDNTYVVITAYLLEEL